MGCGIDSEHIHFEEPPELQVPLALIYHLLFASELAVNFRADGYCYEVDLEVLVMQDHVVSNKL